MREDAVIKKQKFSDTSLEDPFFDSLRADYAGFNDWFAAKQTEEAWAFVTHGAEGHLQGFLYLKKENGPVSDITPPLNIRSEILKIGTFKIDAHGTKLGERFVKKIFDCAISWKIPHIYVTIFEKHHHLITLLNRYGFEKYGTKNTENGIENVYYKNFIALSDDNVYNYPVINASNSIWLLSVFPKYHTGLFPDSRLNTETPNIVEDVSFTNSIHKVYVGRAYDFNNVNPGDIIITYPTAEQGKPAYYNAVATSICTVTEIKARSEFNNNEQSFIDYCLRHSVFDKNDLLYWYRRKDGPELYAVKMTYNVALPKRINRKNLIEKVGIDKTARWTLLKLTTEQLKSICNLGQVYEGVIIY